VYMTRAERQGLLDWVGGGGYANKDRRMAFYLRHGMKPEEILADDQFFELLSSGFSGAPLTIHSVADGDLLTIGRHCWRVLELKGHSQGQMTLHCESLSLWISGDHLLPGIAPNISVAPDAHETNPLECYLGALKSLKHLPEKTLVLPSHGRPFSGLHKHIEMLLDHYNVRLKSMLEACDQPLTAAKVARRTFPKADLKRALWMAVGEALAHLNLLCCRGQLERHEPVGDPVRFIVAESVKTEAI
jgi:glyoxylase-like metal-dependent hydrolase (beta-lactamase superfamily II)